MIELPYDIIKNGGECYLYGGATRDSIIGIDSLDYDFIVRKLSLSKLSSICLKYGEVFPHKYIAGSLRLYTKEYGIIDIALPKKFENGVMLFSEDYTIDNYLSVSTDFTINAIVKNMQNDEIYDPYNGINDIKNKIISLNPMQENLNFSPLATLRAIRFASKFDFSIDTRTMEILERDKEKTFTVSKQRLRFEMHKILSELTYKNSKSLLMSFGLYDRLVDIYSENWD